MILLNGKEINVTIFPDKTSQVWQLPEEVLKTTNYAHVTWEFENEAEFIHLAQLKTLLDAYHFKTTLRMPYLPYARQDKPISNDTTFALIPFAKLLNSLDFVDVIINDPHSFVAEDLIDSTTIFYNQNKVHVAMTNTDSDLICYPDHGAFSKYSSMYPYHYIRGEKVRDQKTGYILQYKVIGSAQGKKVLIVDDICDGGMTFKILARDLLQSGAKEVNLFVSHGIFSKGIKTLKESGINAIYTKDGEVSVEDEQL